MEPVTLGLVAFAGMLVLIALGVPIAFSMLGTSVIGFFILRGSIDHAVIQLGLTFTDQGMNFFLVAVPLYFLMGQLVYRTDIAFDLYDAIYKWLGWLRGGLAITSVVACAGFGAVSGLSLIHI